MTRKRKLSEADGQHNCEGEGINMTQFRANLAVVAAKGVSKCLRLLGRGATTLPGRIALMICPTILSRLSKDQKIIVLTGTNGKTTTTHMVSGILISLGYTVVTNVSGANLATGITTTMIEGIRIRNLAGKQGKKTVYVIEADEAAFAKVAGQLHPTVCVVTNLFRDQLDRYGELVHTQAFIAKGLDATDAGILLDADDSLVAALERGRGERVAFFGLDESSMTRNTVTNPSKSRLGETTADASYCSFCQKKYEYRARSFGHLGAFYCPSCGYSRKLPDFLVSYDTANTTQQSVHLSPSDVGFPVKLSYLGKSVTVGLPIPGLHNFYNTAAAVAACVLLGEKSKDPMLSFEQCAVGIQNVQPAFGRMEKIPVGSKSLCLLLVKNPVGLERALSFVSQATDAGGMYMLLNSNDADGKDVSWIWDVDFESRPYPENIYVSGERYGDMFLRLAYAGIDRARIHTAAMPACGALLDEALIQCEEGKCLYILPNYTAMLALRDILVKRYHLKDFWK
jgi:UDP-N-acetylmuramyl tripeptide synthase